MLRLWIPTNVYSDKVQELNKNDSCSVGAYDRFGNYFVMQGHCVSKVTVERFVLTLSLCLSVSLSLPCISSRFRVFLY